MFFKNDILLLVTHRTVAPAVLRLCVRIGLTSGQRMAATFNLAECYRAAVSDQVRYVLRYIRTDIRPHQSDLLCEQCIEKNHNIGFAATGCCLILDP